MALRRLSQVDESTLTEGAYDVRGWPVRTSADGERAGTVGDMLVDEGGAPRYLEVEVADGGKRVLLPIGQARADEAEDVVWVPGVRREELEAIPTWEGDARSLTPDGERKIVDAYRPAYSGSRYYARPAYRTERPRMSGVGEFVTGRLAPLAELEDYRIAGDDPDPRGWEVVAADGLRAGRVAELIVDTDAGKVRYLDVRLTAARFRGVDGSRNRLIPIGYVRLDEEEGRVIVDALGAAGLERLPAFTGMPIDRSFEERLHEAFLEAYRTGARYRHPRYSHERFSAARRRRTA